MTRRVLIFSLGLNVFLITLAALRPSSGPDASTSEIRASKSDSTRSETHLSVPRSTSRAKRVEPWEGIESSDVRNFMANLRAAGCPEQTIKNLAALRICRAYRQRVLENAIAFARKQSENPYLNQSEWQKNIEETQNIRDEMHAELESVLGEGWASLASSITGFPGGSDGLSKIISAEKLSQARQVDKQFRHDLDELDRKGMINGLEAADMASYRELQRQKREALAAVLSPQELEEYLYRNSPAADYVRRNLPEAKSESEYRMMVKLALEMEMSEATGRSKRYGQNADDDAVRKEREERSAEFSRRLKELLGEDSIAQLEAREKANAEAENRAQEQRGMEQMQSQVLDTAKEFGVSAESARRFFTRFEETKKAMEKKFDDMEKSLTGTPEEKQKQMEAAVKAELNKMAIDTMGDNGLKVIEKLFNAHD
jgi:hypothetical protein